MCSLLREQQLPATQGGETPAPGEHRLRPRLAGVLAAALVGGLAVAALGPSATPPQPQAAAAPLSRAESVRGTAAVERSAALVPDDGVPTDTGVAKASAGSCEHGL